MLVFEGSATTLFPVFFTGGASTFATAASRLAGRGIRHQQ
jgi:hypothetical protein